VGDPSRSAEELMRDLGELQINEGGRPVTRPPPDQRVIDSFQKQFGITLPPQYLSLLRYANGGHPYLDSIEVGDPSDKARWSVNRFYHLDDGPRSSTSLWAATETWRPYLGAHAFPFAADGGGNQFVLDLETSPPSVKVCIHDAQFAIVDVAPSFEEFIERLSVDPDMV
jgi:hypothetical protein